MAVVLLLPGAGIPGSTYGRDKFGGTMFEAPNTYVNIETYNWGINNTDATNGMNNVYNSILSRQGQDIIVAGHSRGGQIIYKLFRERYNDMAANFDPAKLLFISSGNPERKWTGRSYCDPVGAPAVYPGGDYHVGLGLPRSGSGIFRLLDIVRTYDEWADTPFDRSNAEAMANLSRPAASIHGNYQLPTLGLDGFPTNWDDWVRYDEGNVTWLTEKPVWAYFPGSPPNAATIFSSFSAVTHRGMSIKNWEDDRQRRDILVNKAAIESAYRRPEPLQSKIREAGAY